MKIARLFFLNLVLVGLLSHGAAFGEHQKDGAAKTGRVQATDPAERLKTLLEAGPITALYGLSEEEKAAQVDALVSLNEYYKDALALFPECSAKFSPYIGEGFGSNSFHGKIDLKSREANRAVAFDQVAKACRTAKAISERLKASGATACTTHELSSSSYDLGSVAIARFFAVEGASSLEALPAPGFLAIPSNLSSHLHELRLASDLKGVTEEQRQEKIKSVHKYKKTQERKGRDPHHVDGAALADSILSLVIDFAERKDLGVRKEVSKLLSAALSAHNNPDSYRALIIGKNAECEPEIFLSLDSVLAEYEETLSDDKALEEFRKLRQQYGLASQDLDKFQAESAHGESQFVIGGALTEREKAHNEPTHLVDLLVKNGKPRIRHTTPADGGWFKSVEKMRKNVAAPEESVLEASRRHEYAVTRTFDDYARYFGPSFKEHMDRLTEKDHVIDMGSGEGLFLESLAKRDHAPNTTGVTLIMKRESPFTGDRFRYIENDLGKVTDKEILGAHGKAKEMTDIYGVFSYVPEIDKLLARYFSLLRDDGTLHLVFADRRNLFILPDGREVNLKEFLESRYVKGLTVKSVHVWKKDSNDTGISIQKKPGESVVIPTLKLKSAVEGEPPARVFTVEK
jgi:hypothetical protein